MCSYIKLCSFSFPSFLPNNGITCDFQISGAIYLCGAEEICFKRPYSWRRVWEVSGVGVTGSITRSYGIVVFREAEAYNWKLTDRLHMFGGTQKRITEVRLFGSPHTGYTMALTTSPLPSLYDLKASGLLQKGYTAVRWFSPLGFWNSPMRAARFCKLWTACRRIHVCESNRILFRFKSLSRYQNTH